MHWLAKKTLLMLVLHPVLSPLNHWQTYHLITPIPLMITLILLVIILILLMILKQWIQHPISTVPRVLPPLTPMVAAIVAVAPVGMLQNSCAMYRLNLQE